MYLYTFWISASTVYTNNWLGHIKYKKLLTLVNKNLLTDMYHLACGLVRIEAVALAAQGYILTSVGEYFAKFLSYFLIGF